MQSVTKSGNIFKASTEFQSIGLITAGKVPASLGKHTITLNPGEFVGVFDLSMPTYIFDYNATGTVSLTLYNINTYNDFSDLLTEQPGLTTFIFNTLSNHMQKMLSFYYDNYEQVSNLLHFVKTTSNRYQTICKVIHSTPNTLPAENEVFDINIGECIPTWNRDYLTCLCDIATKSSSALTPAYLYGFINHLGKALEYASSQLVPLDTALEKASALLFNEEYLDYYELYSSLYHYADNIGTDTSAISNVLNSIAEMAKSLDIIDDALIDKRVIEFKSKTVVSISTSQSGVNDAIMMAKLASSVSDIIQFSGVDAVTGSNFKRLLDAFKALPDRESGVQAVTDLRKEFTASFNTIYSAVIKNAIKCNEVSTIIKMFINFGYVDSELIGSDNSIELYKIAESFDGDLSHSIYTLYDWFKAIYSGRKMPSKSEFDQDYVGYVNTLIKEGRIRKDDKDAMLDNRDEMIDYELSNLFPSINRITFGRILSYCPVLTDDNLIKAPGTMLLTPMKLLDSLGKFNDIDYSAFYHEYIYEDYSRGIKDTARRNILPDIILMPNVGTRGIMWQEIEGVDRKTPGRVFFSIFFSGDLDKAMLRVMGEFRWEMCKREAGLRWNDFTTHCLTSDYCDYAQFFQKNNDLSSDAKDKIRETLKRCKNSYKEMFVNDYILYMLFETNGACRLNKIARSIIFKYCPPCKESRHRLSGNAIFEDAIRRHEISLGQALHRLDVIETKYRTLGVDIPDEINLQRKLLEQ